MVQNLESPGSSGRVDGTAVLASGRCQTPFEGFYNKVYLLLRDAKLLLRYSIYKLNINTVYLLLRDAKLLLRDSIVVILRF